METASGGAPLIEMTLSGPHVPAAIFCSFLPSRSLCCPASPSALAADFYLREGNKKDGSPVFIVGVRRYSAPVVVTRKRPQSKSDLPTAKRLSSSWIATSRSMEIAEGLGRSHCVRNRSIKSADKIPQSKRFGLNSVKGRNQWRNPEPATSRSRRVVHS